MSRLASLSPKETNAQEMTLQRALAKVVEIAGRELEVGATQEDPRRIKISPHFLSFNNSDSFMLSSYYSS